MALTQSKSVSELSQIRSLSDLPVPENIERLISRAATNSRQSADQRSVLQIRVRQLEERVGDLEARLGRLEQGGAKWSVRFCQTD